jgi:hypothetical protein
MSLYVISPIWSVISIVGISSHYKYYRSASRFKQFNIDYSEMVTILL